MRLQNRTLTAMKYNANKKNEERKMKNGLTWLCYVAIFSLFTFHFSLISAQVRIGGSVYGGGNKATVTDSVKVTLGAGTVAKSVYGGGNQAGVNGTTTVTINGGTVGGSNEADTYGVYGGSNQEGNIAGSVTVNINGGTLGTGEKHLKGIFGGGYGSRTTTGSDVTVNIGQLDGVVNPTVYGDIYGGSALGSVNDINNYGEDTTRVNFLGGTLYGNLYGGGLGKTGYDNKDSGAVYGLVMVNVGDSNQANADCHVDLTRCNVYGCNNQGGYPRSDVFVNIFKTAHDSKNLASYTGDDATYAIKNVFGGGHNAENEAQRHHTWVKVFSCQNTVGRVFGGGDAASVDGVGVEIWGGRFDQVFGGGNGELHEASVGQGGTNTIIHGGLIGQLFGGSNTQGSINGAMNTQVLNDGSCDEDIEDFFGGSNLVEIVGNVETTIGCGTRFHNVYGGSNKADIKGNVTLNIRGGTINNVFGGSKGVMGNGSSTVDTAANIKDYTDHRQGQGGKVTLNLYGGTITNAFGGSNICGNIEGLVTVNVTEDDSLADNCALHLTNVYGASNLATYRPTYSAIVSPVVNINHVKNGSFIAGNVYGGGRGAQSTFLPDGSSSGDSINMGMCVSNPQVNIGDDSSNHYVKIHGNVYGGGALAYVDGSTAVNMRNANSEVHTILEGNLFGAGQGYVGDSLAANVTKNATVTISGGRVNQNVYGGGELASVGTFATTANGYDIASGTGTTTVTITGGHIGADDADHATSYNTGGNVYGAGLGKAGHQVVNGHTYNFSYYNYVKNTDITIGNADLSSTQPVVRGSVFGGGEDGHVWNNTSVKIKGGEIGTELLGNELVENSEGVGVNIYTGNVYGGGRGIDEDELGNHIHSLTAGRVFGNTYVEVSGGLIHHSVYGGGSLASVGDTIHDVSGAGIAHDIMGNIIDGQYTLDTIGGIVTRDYQTGDPVTGTGLAHVRICGGRVGHTGHNEGSVFGSGRGLAGDAAHSEYYHMAFVHNTKVYIKDTIINADHRYADVRESVFGGGANGHVTQNSYVNVSAGVVGGKTYHDYAEGSVPTGDSIHVGDKYYHSGIAAADTLTDRWGRIPEGHTTFLGNVYAGGRGVDHNASDQLSRFAGRVFGNATVEVSGGVIYHSVYGGGSMASVGYYIGGQGTNMNISTPGTGKAVVKVTGGRIGTNGRNNGRVFGSSRGLAGSSYSFMAYVNTSDVTIGDSAEVRGAVFGGGEDGHVLDSTLVKIEGGIIGNGIRTGKDSWINDYVGNVYGAGRGVDLDANKNPSATAGWVRGSTHVTVSGGHIHHNVYGGGSLASVGTDGISGYTNTTGKNGRAWVEVTGGTIGLIVDATDASKNLYGNVYGAGRGRAGIGIVNGNNWDELTYVSNTRVIINSDPSDANNIISGNVFGGGNNGHVNNSTYVTVTRGKIGTRGNLGYGSLEGNVFGGGRGEDSYECYLTRNGHYLTNAQLASGSGYIDSMPYNRNDRTKVKNYYKTARTYADSLATGDSLSLRAGLVYGNTNVFIGGIEADSVQVLHNVYGGGSMASVGDIRNGAGIIASLTPGTGNTNVYITGGTFGTTGTNNGMVFGSSRGDIGAPFTIGDTMAWVGSTCVVIGDTTQSPSYPATQTLIKGSVYGGGENGHVYRDTYVHFHDGLLGCSADEYTAMDDTQKAKNFPYRGNLYGAGCGTDTYNDGEKERYNLMAGSVMGNTQVVVSGGYISRNVYGAGSMGSVGTIVKDVKHEDVNTTFALSWPHEFAYAPNTGNAIVIIKGGHIGTVAAPTTSGDVYGSARGEAGDRYEFATLANVNTTKVSIEFTNPSSTIDGNNAIVGSVYGSGENGHVNDSTLVSLESGLVGGSLFGGGKGSDTYKDRMRNISTHVWDSIYVRDITAGKVYGNTYVKMSGGQVNHNVYGGGYQASVGKGNYNGPYGEGSSISTALKDSAENSGHCYVTITGGIIGSDTSDINRGHIFGAGKGIVFPMSDSLGYDYNRDFYVAYTNKTFITIGDSNNRNTDFVQPHVTGSVFGGGEDGHVRYDTYVKVCSGQIGINCTDSITSDVGNWAYRGNVFGAGRGIDKLPGGGFCQSAGSVTRNTRIDILGGRVYRNVQGGGSMASVGTPAGYSGDPSTCVINVNLPSDNDSLGAAFSKMYAFGGYIGGGSRGIASPNGTDSSDLATCHNTQINLYRGFVRNTIYGGGENGQILGNTEINIYGGRVRSAIYGGGKGSFKAPPSETGDATGNYDNDTLSGYIHGNTTVNLLGGVVPYTYGGGRRASSGGDATINIGKDSLDNDGSYYGNVAFDPKKNSVYGGNQYAGSPRGDIYVNVYSTAHGSDPAHNKYPDNVTDSGSLVRNDAIQTYAIGKVYGGSYNSPYIPRGAGHRVTVHVYGCDNTIGELYGGASAADIGSDLVSANTNLIIDGGRFKRVFGGGDGSFDRYIGHSVPANIYGTASTVIHSGLITEFFGGSNTSGNITTISTQIDDPDTTRCPEVIGNLYTGSNESDIYGGGELIIACGAGKFSEVYGGSNNAIIHGDVTLTIQGGTIGTVFGGSKGRLADTTATDTIDAFAADIDGNVTLNLVGGTIGDAFGGSNINGAISGVITVNVLDTCQECPLTVKNVYGAGNITPYTPDSVVVAGLKVPPISPIVNINHTRADSTFTGSVYGGGFGTTAVVTANPQVTIGDTNRLHTALVGTDVYGGGSLANVIGNTKVLIQNPNTRVSGDIYGGGALANVQSTSVTLNAGYVGGNIYGGGLGRLEEGFIPAVEAVVDGDVQVSINGGRASTVYGANNINGAPTGSVHVDIYHTDSVASGYAVSAVYGGGNHAKYDSIPYVTIHNCNNKIEYVYGGGNAASVRGTHVTVYGGDTIGNVYGGGNAAGITRYGTRVDVHGGTIGSVYGGNNQSGTIAGDILVNVNKEAEGTDPACEMHIARVYGGGNHADSKAGHISIGCTGGETEGIDTVYGGANQANIDGAIVLDITGGHIGNVFGGNNISGNISDSIVINVDWNNSCEHNYLGNVYGAGNLAEYSPTFDTIVSPVVNLINGTVSGNVYGGGLGMGTKVISSAATNMGRVASNPVVNIGATSTAHANGVVLVKGNVFGGGALAKVAGNTQVNMLKGTVDGSLFGAGEGCDSNMILALVMKNSTVNMIDGRVKGSVYGGGNLSSVGYYIYDSTNSKALPDSCRVGTGHSAVYISGGIVGPDTLKMPTFKGHIFGGGKGMVADPVVNPYITSLGYSGTTEVVVSGDAFIKGSVYGGSESGHVFDSTYVKIQGGQIGAGFNYAKDTNYGPYTVWDTVKLDECHHWPFAQSNLTYDPYADKYDSKGGAVKATDGHTYYGNVFGGGSGIFPYQPVGRTDTAIWSRTAGAVYGNTRVEVTGGHILTSLYGGNEMTNVGTYDNAGNCIAGGTATVIMTDGTLGVPRTLDSIAAHPVTCYLFGAGKGDPRIFFNTATNIDSAYIHVSGGRIYGSIFGGGEDGHVMRHVSLNVDSAAYIGTEGKSYVDGNIFGAGRGFSGEALTAGTVGGNVTVNIGGNSKMLGNVYGGGRLASVGTLFTAPNDPGYGHMIDGDDHGNVTINISGDAVIGNQAAFGDSRPSHLKSGNVYGGSMGRLELLDGTINPIWPGLAKVKNTQINIADNAVICASVFGGGELGTVTGNTELNITGTNVRIGTVKRDANDSILYRFGSLFGGGYGTDDTTTTNDSTRASYLIAGRVYGNTVVNLNEGAIANNVFGGGKMAYIGDEKVASSGNTTVNIGNANQNSNSVIIGNNVFGANDESGSPLGSTTVHIYHTAHNADNSYPTPAPTNASELAANMANQQYSIAAVYGGGNLAAHVPADTVNSTTLVYVHYCDNTIRDIYGGGNAAYTRNNSVVIDGGRIHRVFGGGNGYSATGNHSDPTAPDYNPGAGALGTATTAIHGGLIDTVFGGSNQYGYINHIEFILDNQRSDGGDACAQVIGGLFGGGNESPGGGGEITIACGAGYFSEVYGGANMATIGTPDAPSDVTLNIQGGRIDKVFGGSKGDTTTLGSGHKDLASHIYGNVTVNVTGGELGYVYGGSNYNGNISGIITVNVDSTQSSCPLTIANNVYGASYITMYKPNNRDARSPVVNIKHGTVGGNVFGGGDGQGARTCSNPTVYMGNGDYTNALSDPNAPTATARIIDVKPVVKGNVYGGGNAARVLGNTLVEMLDGIVDGSLYAACKGKPYAELAGDAEKETRAIVDGWTTLNLKGGLVKDCLYGGGELGQVGHLENNSLSKYDTEADTIKAKYGNTYITMTGGTVGAEGAAATHGNVYGGGQGNTESPLTGRVQGNTSVKISSGHVRHNVYGGGSLASVGTLTYGGALSIVSDVKPGTGTATLYITGGTIGTTGVENGIIFGSSRGDIDTIGSRQDTLAWVGNTIVTIGDTTAPHNMNAPQIKGSIYGGGENGHVHRDAYVHVYSGQVGYQNATNPALDEDDPNYPYRGNVYGAGCGTDTYMDVVRDIANGNTIIKSKADPTKDSIAPHYNVNAGVVHGNTHVVVSGGHIMHNVYGGGAMGSVGTLNSVPTYHTDEATQFALSWPVVLDYMDSTGTATVDITGGRIGTTGSFDGDVFGGARGEAGDRYQMARYANVKKAVVNIAYDGNVATFSQALDALDTTPCVTGSVHGGAENGHIYTDAHVNLSRGLVGHALYGGGSGKGQYIASLRKRDGSGDSTASVYSLTAGRVYGNTYVTMSGGQVGRSVYGGGNQGSVGKGNYAGGPGDYSSDGYGERWNEANSPLIDTLANSGHTYVYLTGGTLGVANKLYKDLPTGNVFGGCRGMAAPNVPPTLSPRILYCPEFFLGYVNHTHVVIGDTTTQSPSQQPLILGSVYGGGMDGHVRMDANVLVAGGEIGLAYNTANQTTVATNDLTSPHWVARGSVFGAGSGNGTYTDNTGTHQSNSAGSVTQFTTVDIEGGLIHHNVYGGGLLSTVGQPRIRKTYDAPIDSTLSLVIVGGGIVGDETSFGAGYGGNVFGGSRGDITVDTNFAKVIYARVNVQNNADILGNVYGGGELGLVKHEAWVLVSGGTVRSNVFGGGKGLASNEYYGAVNGNTFVDMTDGMVKGSLYGGGELGSVGTLSALDNGTGYIQVNISGGTIGKTDPYVYFTGDIPANLSDNIYDTVIAKNIKYYDTVAGHVNTVEIKTANIPNILTHTASGNVYGGCMGSLTLDDGTTNPIWPALARCRKTRVTISGNAIVRSSVYGGGELGTVIDSTVVNILGGTIGTDVTPANATARATLRKYSNKERFKDFYTNPQDPDYVDSDTLLNPHYYFGSVYGGGYGSYDTVVSTIDLDLTHCPSLTDNSAPARLAPVDIAGRVYGRTYVNVKGGATIRENVFGGGDLASVGTNVYDGSSHILQSTDTARGKGICIVTIANDTVSTNILRPVIGPLDFTGNNANVYAAGKGVGNDPQAHYKYYCNVDSTNLTLSGGHVWGSTFGGGADCHVLGSTHTYVENTSIVNGMEIGDRGITEYDGYVFGGGRNFQNLNNTAGRVQGNTHVDVAGGRIKCTIIGGGSLARTGVDMDGDIASFITAGVYDSVHHGSTFVNVSGTTDTVAAFSTADSVTYRTVLGTTHIDSLGKVVVYNTAIGTGYGPYLLDCDYSIGDIFGGGKGDTRDTVDITAGRVMNTFIDVSGSPRIMADIYAGGEMGCIGWYDISGPNTGKYYAGTGYTHIVVNDSPYLGTPYEFTTENFRAGVTWSIVDPDTKRLLHTCSGNIYGGGQGFVEEGYTNWVSMGRVRRTEVTINGVRMLGNVFGGGSRGVVMENTYVNIHGGHIGTVIHDNVPGALDTLYYYGSVFAGGYGNPKKFLHVNDSCRLDEHGNPIPMIPTEYAGRIYGDSYLEVTGGHIMECVFGGGDLASTGFVKADSTLAGGACYVTVGGTAEIGPLDYSGQNAYIYGAGRGIAYDDEEEYTKCSNVNTTYLTVNGGKIWGSTFGGGADAHVLGDVSTTIHTGANIGTEGITTYDGNIFGGGRNYLHANRTAGRVQGNISVIMDGGTIMGSIFGGGRLALSGIDADGDYIDSLHGNVVINVSGSPSIGNPNGEMLLKGSDESVGDIFGSGKGDTKDYEDIWAGRVTNTIINISDNPRIYGAVFGGGEMASIGYWDTTSGAFYDGTGSAVVTISGTPVIGTELEFTAAYAYDDPNDPDDGPSEWTVYDDNGNLMHTCAGNVYGGCQGDVDVTAPHWVSMGRSRQAKVTINGGYIMGDVFGGAEQGIVTGNTSVTINGGKIGTPILNAAGTDTLFYFGSVYGAGYGSDDPTEDDDTTPNDSTLARQAQGLPWTPAALAGRVYGNSEVLITGTDTIRGSVFGGAGLAYVGYKRADGSYSGGNTRLSIGTPVQTSNNVVILGNVYGANNLKGSPYGDVTVDIWKTAHVTSGAGRNDTSDNATAYALQNVFGGGNQADYIPDGKRTFVHIHNCDNTVKNVYGGGNAAAVSGTDLIVDGGRFDNVFGGGNGEVTAANVGTGGTNTSIRGGKINHLFGGGNKQGTISGKMILTIDTTGGSQCAFMLDTVFGGGNEAGGDSIVVTITCGTQFDAVFGGANNADIGDPLHWKEVELNVLGGDITQVFGGNNKGGTVYGNVTVNIHGGTIDEVFGGSNFGGDIKGRIIVNIDSTTTECATNINTVYGAGNEVDYTPSTPGNYPEVNLIQGTIHQSVFGGGKGTDIHPATVTSNPHVNIGIYPERKVCVGGTIVDNEGNTIRHGYVFGGGNASPVVGNTTVDVRGKKTMVHGNVYGGGNAAPVSGNTDVQIGNTPTPEP